MKSNRQHKVKQLCRQVSEALSYVLGEVTGNDDLVVLSVGPAADSSCLPVILRVDVPPDEFDADAISKLLQQHKGELRGEIAASINRKKTPDLTFIVLGPTDHPPELQRSE